MKKINKNKIHLAKDWLAQMVRRMSNWAWREQLECHQNVTEDAQSLVDALLRGETADAYCGYGRDGQASNYRDELKWSLRDFESINKKSRQNQ